MNNYLQKARELIEDAEGNLSENEFYAFLNELQHSCECRIDTIDDEGEGEDWDEDDEVESLDE